MYRRGLLPGLLPIAIAAIAVIASPVLAEKVDLSSEQLWEVATHVVTGKVTGIYAKRETDGDWRYTHLVAESLESWSENCRTV